MISGWKTDKDEMGGIRKVENTNLNKKFIPDKIIQYTRRSSSRKEESFTK
jgi:hypothetical protein